MKYLEMTDGERRLQEERRAAGPAVGRRARTAVAAGGVLTAVVLGWWTAVGTGLTTTGRVAEAGLAPAPSGETDWAEPAMRRTLAAPARPTRPAARPSARPADPPPVAVTPTVPPAPPSQPRPRPTPRPAPSPTLAAASPASVRKGDPCPVAGARGVTRSGAAMVCTVSPGNGRMRWRAA